MGNLIVWQRRINWIIKLGVKWVKESEFEEEENLSPLLVILAKGNLKLKQLNIGR